MTDDSYDELFKAMRLCRADAKEQRGVQGSVECPSCKGKLNYTIAASNGHLWGQCETENCLRWLQ